MISPLSSLFSFFFFSCPFLFKSVEGTKSYRSITCFFFFFFCFFFFLSGNFDESSSMDASALWAAAHSSVQRQQL